MRTIIFSIALLMSTVLCAQGKVDLPQTKADFERIEADAKGGDAPAQYVLAQCYKSGVPGIVNMNNTTSRKWMKKAADGGNPYACVEVYNWDKLGNVAYGEKAKKILLEIKSGEAYRSMAELYVYGTNNQLMWLKAAMISGDAEAEKWLKTIYRSKSTSDDFKSWVARIPNTVDGLTPDDNISGRKDSNLKPVIARIDNDVDLYAPENPQTNKNTFALIIGNENYAHLPDVPFAANDASVFKTYCERTLGIPVSNIIDVSNGTYANMIESMEKLKQKVSLKKGNANIIFYYAGHGLPDNTGKAYMIPQDVSGLNQRLCYSLEDVMKDLSNMDSKGVVCFLDACFSGTKRDDNMLESGGTRAIRRNVDMGVASKNMVVFSATSNDQTAWPYNEKGHGLFTYFLLKKMKDKKGDMTLKELAVYIKENVQKTASDKNIRIQEPTVTCSHNIESTWGDMKLRY